MTQHNPNNKECAKDQKCTCGGKPCGCTFYCTCPNDTKLDEIVEEFRKQYDELGLKAPKNSMPNLERELIVDFWKKQLTSYATHVREEMVGKIEEMPDHYPVDIFPEPPEGWQKQLSTWCESQGYAIDNISAWYARWQSKVTKDDIITLLRGEVTT